MGNSREIAAEALCRVENDGAYSNIIIGNLLVGDNLSKEDKALATALFYGVLDRKLTLDFYIGKLSSVKVKKIEPMTRQALRIGIYQLCYMKKIPVNAAVNESVNIVKGTSEERNSGFINAILRNAADKLPQLPTSNDLYSLSVRNSCPVWIIEELLRDYGVVQTEEIIKAYLLPAKLSVCVNTLKTTASELYTKLSELGIDSMISPEGDSLDIFGGIDFKNNKLFNEGYFYVQDTVSKNCAKVLDAVPDERILDVCAAPGGKSFTIAQSMKNTGEIVSCDLYKNRVSLIEDGAKRLGISNLKAIVNDATVYNETFGRFDAVICDVVCSGFGVIRRKPEIKYKKAESFDELEKIQEDILNTSSKYVKNGGRLLYSTCTLRKNENEKQVEKFLSTHRDFVCKCMKTDLPCEEHDGFFYALLIRN